MNTKYIDSYYNASPELKALLDNKKEFSQQARNLINPDKFMSEVQKLQQQPLFRNLYGTYNGHAAKPGEEKIHRDDFVFIPLWAGEIMNMMGFAQAYFPNHFNKPFNFYDLGSGFGNVLYIAKKLFPRKAHVFGIEKYHTYKRLKCMVKPTIYKDFLDLRPYMFPKDKPCVFYAYNPLRDCKAMHKALEHIVEVIPAGSIIMFRPAMGFDPLESPRIDFVVSHNAMYIKIKDNEKTDRKNRIPVRSKHGVLRKRKVDVLKRVKSEGRVQPHRANLMVA